LLEKRKYPVKLFPTSWWRKKVNARAQCGGSFPSRLIKLCLGEKIELKNIMEMKQKIKEAT